MSYIITSITVSNDAVKKVSGGRLWLTEKDVVGRKPNVPSVARLFDKRGKFIAHAFVSPGSTHFIRIFSRVDLEINFEFWRKKVLDAFYRREKISDVTDAYRIVHSEADGIPSVVIDKYNNVFAIQISSSGAELIKDELVQILIDEFHPSSIVEKNDLEMRKKQDLKSSDQIIYGKEAVTSIREQNLRFEVDVLSGQKTGAYLDYRSIRAKASELACGTCLDLFCYQGWLACLVASHAERVTAVDGSSIALSAAKKNTILNSIQNIDFVKADAFNFLDGLSDKFDFIHIDPPAMAAKRANMTSALKQYEKLARLAANALTPNGILMISSCSHRITERLLEESVAKGIDKAGRDMQVIWRGIQDSDHPVLSGHAESLYLKALAIKVK